MNVKGVIRASLMLLGVLVAPAMANQITATVSKDGKTVTVTGKPDGTGSTGWVDGVTVSVTSETPATYDSSGYHSGPSAGPGGSAAAASATHSATVSVSGGDGALSSSDSLTIKIGSDTWSGIKADGSVVLSKQQDKHGGSDSLDDGSTDQLRGSGLNLNSSYGSLFALATGTYGQFNLVNTGATGYAFVSLHVYEGINDAFFGTSQFDSAAAIASSTSSLDILSVDGPSGIGPAGLPGFAGELTLGGFGPLPANSYLLLVGTVAADMGNDEFGPQQSFSIATALIPEPGTPELMGVGMLGVILGASALKRSQRRDTISGRSSVQLLARA